MVDSVLGIKGKKGELHGGLKALLAIGGVAFILFVLLPGISGLSVWSNIGVASTAHPISPPEGVDVVIDVTLGGPIQTWENLVISIIIFLILFFAFSELIQLFTTFSTTTAWIIGFGLALLSGVTKVVANLAALMGGVAAIGSVGIALIIIAGIASGVILNLGIGGPVRKWRVNRQKDINKLKSEQGWNKVASGAKGLKDVDAAASAGESA